MAKKKRRRTGLEMTRASIVIDVATYARWSAAACLARMDRSEFAVNAIDEACRGLFLTDRRKPNDRVKLSDRPDEAPLISPDAPDDAA